MKPLVVLATAFAVSLLGLKLAGESLDLALSGRIALSVLLAVTSLAHFKFTRGMTMMLPEGIPHKTAVVYLTGIFELLAAIALFIPAVRVLTAWLLIAFFIAILPANIHAAVKRIDYQKAGFTGPGLPYLWFRVPLQLLFIGWVYFSVLF